jgi:membrane-associated phospholipid phosphatase
MTKKPDRTPEILIALSAATGMALLARELDFECPTRLDQLVRERTHSLRAVGARQVLAPMFALGLPGGYITVAYLTANWLRRRNARGGPAIVSSAWLGWLVHRGAKLVYSRVRPPSPRVRSRTDSYPSGHTTGATALALTTALVLERQGLVSRNRARAIAIGAPLAMGMYRVIDDEHWITDVIGGWLLGTAIGVGCDVALGNARPRRVRRALETSRKSSRRHAHPASATSPA